MPQPGGAVFEQLAEKLRDDIRTGRLAPGQKLPSETTLSQEFGIARETARRAVGVLRAEGLVTPVRGHGVLVRENPELQDFAVPLGASVTARMLTPAERAELAVDEGVPVFVVVLEDGSSRLLPSDRWRLRWAGPHP